MSASLVGSEMCIRDRRNGALGVVERVPGRLDAPQLLLESQQRGMQGNGRGNPVWVQELQTARCVTSGPSPLYWAR
eukprot:10343279-Alexandrium_andersonii.AAC.1